MSGTVPARLAPDASPLGFGRFRPAPLLWALLGLGLLVRLPFMPFDFRAVNDMALFRAWAQGMYTQGLTSVYELPDVGNPNYPPGLMYYLAAAGWLSARWGSFLGGQALLNTLIKLPAVLADVATAALLAWALPGAAPRQRLLACALYLFNPATWYLSAHWGQFDSVYVLPLLASLLWLERGRSSPAWLAWGLALAIKLQSLLLGPLLAAITWQRRGAGKLAQGLALGGGLWLLLASPWLLAGKTEILLRAITRPYAIRLTAHAYNLWYFLAGVGLIHTADSLAHPLGGPVSYRLISAGLYGAFALCVLLVVWIGRPKSLALAAAFLSLGLFLLLTDMHERYLIPVLAFLLLAAARAVGADRRLLWGAYATVALTFLLNLVIVAPFTPWLGLRSLPADLPWRLPALRAVTLGVAFVNLGLLPLLSLVAARLPQNSERV